MDIQAEKALLVQKMEKVNNPDLILAIKNLLDFGLKMEEKHQAVPENHKAILEQRLKDYEKNPDKIISLDEFKKRMEERL